MDKKVIILAVVAAATGIGLGILRSPERKGAKVQEAFPPEKLKGYVEKTTIKVVDDGKGKGGLGAGGSVLAIAVTPFGIRPEQVSPTGYGALMALHHEFKESNWISVFIAEDSAMADASNWVGVAEYRNGVVTVTGGIPSQKQIDSLGKAGTPVHKPTKDDLKVVATVFDSTGSISGERWDLSQNLLGAGQGRVDKSRFLILDLQTGPLHAAAKALGKDPKEVQSIVQGVTRYYWMDAGEPL